MSGPGFQRLAFIAALAVSVSACQLRIITSASVTAPDTPPEDSPPTIPAEGTLTGIGGGTVTIQVNGGNDLGITGDGPFTLNGFTPGQAYEITIHDVPAGKTCAVTSGASGTVPGSGTLSVEIDCADVAVQALYPSNGLNWNDYVRNDGADVFSSSGDACLGNAENGRRGPMECLHGGEMRVVALTGWTACDGLAAADTLGVFEWTCDDSSGVALAVSLRVKDSKGLTDLIDGTPAWAENSVVVTRGSDTIARTALADDWWGNTVAAETTGGSLTGTGTIKVVSTDINSFIMGDDKMAVVIRPGTVLTPDSDRLADLADSDYGWLEGGILDMQSGSHTRPVYLNSSNFNVVRNLRTINSPDFGLDVSGNAQRNRFENIEIYDTKSGHGAIYLYTNANYNFFRNIRVANGGSGIITHTSSGTRDNVFHNIVGFDSGSDGIGSQVTANNRYVNVHVNSSHRAFTHPSTASNGLLLNAFVTSIASTAYQILGPDFTLSNLVAFDAAQDGLFIGNNAHRTQVHHVLSAHHQDDGVNIDASNHNYFTGLLRAGNNGDEACEVAAGTLTGLVTGCTQDGSTDATLLASDALVDATSGVFLGKQTNDSVNGSENASGQADYMTVRTVPGDFFAFESWFRNWIRVRASELIDWNVQGRPSTGHQIQVYDFRLRETDTLLRDQLPLPTGDDVLVHVWGASDQTDCETNTIGSWGNACSLPGYRDSGACTTAGGTWAPRCHSVFLRNAYEPWGDGKGNDNLLCESGETCIYTPNLGVYQGEGELIPAGAFVDGELTGITLLQHEINGR